MSDDWRSLVDSIRGDLAEERARRLKTQPRWRVAVWSARTAAGIALYLSVRRVQAIAALAGPELRHVDRLATEGRQAVRGLARAPWYAVTVICVVALTFALSTTVFALVDGVLFKPLPYRAPSELFRIAGKFNQLPDFLMGSVSVPDARAWAAVIPDAQLTAFDIGDAVTIGELETLRSAGIDASFFEVLGVRPMIGGFSGADFGPRAKLRPALLTFSVWQSRFGGDVGVVGRTFADASGAGIRVAGILPRDFVFPFHAGVVAPLALTPIPATTDRPTADSRQLNAIVRLPRGMPFAPLLDHLRAATRQVAASYPALPPPTPGMSPTRMITRGPFDDVRLTPLSDVLSEGPRTLSAAVFGTAAALVLLAVLNLASLAAGRALDRRRELTLRRALGGTAFAIARPLLAESTIVIGVGAVAGLLAARWLLEAALAMLPRSTLLLKPPEIDWRVIAFAGAAAVSAIAAVTAWSARAAIRPTRKGSIAGAAGTTESSRSIGRGAIIAAEIALALLMIVGATLVAASLMRVWQQPSGFSVDHNAALAVTLPREIASDYVPTLLKDVEKVPGVRVAGGLGYPFLQNAWIGCSFDVPAGQLDDAECVYATAGALKALDLRVVEGHLPSAEEFDHRRAIVISQSLARRYWPDASALGRMLTRDGTAYEIAGVVEDARFRALDAKALESIYVSVFVLPRPGLQNIIVSFDGDPADGLDAVRAALTTHHPELRLRSARQMVDALSASSSVQQRTFQAWLFSAFGAAALVVAGVGVLGSLAMATARRTRELGVRLALGATRAGVVGMIVREHFKPVGIGVIAGTAVGVWAARFVRSLLYEMTPYDWSAWSIGIGAIVVVALAASIIPAWRAGRVDPVTALRVEG